MVKNIINKSLTNHIHLFYVKLWELSLKINITGGCTQPMITYIFRTEAGAFGYFLIFTIYKCFSWVCLLIGKDQN